MGLGIVKTSWITVILPPYSSSIILGYLIYRKTFTHSILIQCPACFNYIGKYAESCPYCGTPRQKKVSNPMLLDAISIFALAFAVFAYMAHQTGFASAVMVIDWLIYAIYYCAIKDNKDIDSSKVKQSLITISILFLLTFGISFVVTITFK